MPRYIAFVHKIIKARQGNEFFEAFDFLSFSLAGKSARCQVREEFGGKVIFTFQTSDSTILISGNVLTLYSTAANFTIPVGDWVYDIELFTNANDVQTMIEGTFEVIDQVTKL